jgi:hypothetical protein
LNVGSICARNYLGSVLLLAESLRRVHPTWPMTVLLVDSDLEHKQRYVEDFPQVQWLVPEELSWGADTINRMKLYYDVTEFSTALKPALLTRLLEEDETAMYLDPDIEVFNSLDELEQFAVSDSLVLLPHVTQPVPRDGLDPKEETFLLSGQFNLGFIAVSRAAKPFLDYWNERVEFDARIDHEHGYFTDQRWVDAVPSLFDHRVVKTPGYNVAYWNLHEFQLDAPKNWRDESEVTFGGVPLRFFHYSGFDVSRPDVLSKYAPNPRVTVAQSPTLRELLLRRASRMEALEIPLVPYRWNRLPDGRKIANALRNGYRLEVQDAVTKGGSVPPSPFSMNDTSASFSDWLSSKATDGFPGLAVLYLQGDSGATYERGGSLEDFAQQAERLTNDQDFLAMSTPEDLRSLYELSGRDLVVQPGFNVTGQSAETTDYDQQLSFAIGSAGYPYWEQVLVSRILRGPIPLDFPYCINLIHFSGDNPALYAEIQRRPVNVCLLDDKWPDGLEDWMNALGIVEIWVRSPELKIELDAWCADRPVKLVPNSNSKGDELRTWVGESFERLMEGAQWQR